MTVSSFALTNIDRAPDIVLGNESTQSQVSYWRPASDKEIGYGWVEIRPEIPPNKDSSIDSYANDIALGAMSLSESTFLDPYFDYMGYRGVYQKDPATNGQPERTYAGVTVVPAALRNERLQALRLAPRHRPPMVRSVEGIFPPEDFLKELLVSGQLLVGVDETIVRDGRLVVTNPQSIHDSVSHTALGFDFLDGATIDSLKPVIRSKMANGNTEAFMLWGLDLPLSVAWLGKAIISAFEAESQHNTDPRTTTSQDVQDSWRHVGKVLTVAQGIHFPDPQTTLALGLGRREHCIALVTAAKRARQGRIANFLHRFLSTT
jgi:hypothetical protein